MRRSRPALFIFSVLFLACRPLLRGPEIRVRAAAFRSADELEFTLVFKNPNRIGLEVADFAYRVRIDTLECAKGRRVEPIHLRALDSVQAVFPIQIDYDNLARAFPTLFRDSVDLSIDGSYTLPRVLGRRRLAFRHTGRFSLRTQLEGLLRNLFQ
ncbi:MAG: LEA type 2 family protein [candidate division WOR-3 bacterium]